MAHLKQQKITWFILVLHWAMDVIYDFYYIHGPIVMYTVLSSLDACGCLGVAAAAAAAGVFVCHA